jgi:hypothetical protein
MKAKKKTPIKLIWRVDPVPTGPFASFNHRSWPSATFENGDHCCCICCADHYEPSRVKSGDHRELALSMADYDDHKGGAGWTAKRMVWKCKTLKEAKEFAAWLLTQNQKWLPMEYRDKEQGTT